MSKTRSVLWTAVAAGLAALSVLAVPCEAYAGKVTFESLLKEMTDMEGLAEFPDPAYTCKQFSSYDQRSTDPSVPTDENWFANGDRGQHLRKESRNGKDEWVMVDAEGPGAIVRIWSANAKDAGIIRVYLDRSADPVIEMPLADMLDGKHGPYLSPISGVRSRGWNTHMPIPYAKHCKITASKPNFYYQVNYRTYAKGARVETFAPNMFRRQERLLKRVTARLATCETPSVPKSATTMSYAEPVAPGKSTMMTFAGPAAIYRFTCKGEAKDLEAALRGCLLEIAFDGQAPSIQAPLGDFFGTAPGPNPYRSLCSGVMEDGRMYCHWVMPFKESAQVRITNTTDAPVTLAGEIDTVKRKWTPNSMYFHAKWRAEYPIPTRPRQDWTYVACTGKGRFVGDMLHITNPVKHWWGEGDEKIYVDGEAFPSHFGTGTEDYYGYAWCFNLPFTHAYHNQPRCDGPGNYGQTCVSRYHILDNIPFTKSFRFDMEVWHWQQCEIAMAATSYWYAQAGGTDAFAKPEAATLKVIAPPPLPEAKRVKGAIEGEEIPVVTVTGGTTKAQESESWGWSAGKQIWWMDAKPGDLLELAVPVEKAGKYEVYANFTKAPDYGIMQLSVNGKKAGEPRDFFFKEVASTKERGLGTFTLKRGTNLLAVEVVGSNPKCDPKRHMFGLDYLLLVPAK